ncbi:MAG: OstA-like protein [Bacteroidota bacterium]|nr:OstA-like protein [Bacteroidota bacterium]MDP4229699.1 OstA-like protein [Bacteroidota bacterium]MDP4236603.1 OstA-like protein [Bacteroidota bacterium]
MPHLSVREILLATLFMLLVSLPLRSGFAQGMINITADQQIGSSDKVRFLGHFRFQHGSLYGQADSAIRYPLQNTLDLYGDVLIRQDTLSVEAPFVHYDGTTRIARGDDGVKFSDRDANITSRWATYDLNLQRADFHEFVRASQDKTVLTSNDLTYFRSTQTSIARGKVFVRADSGTVKADEVTNAKTLGETIARGNVEARNDSLIILSQYLYESKPLGLLTASGNVQAYSIQNNTIQYGDTLARFRKTGYSIVPKNPLLLIIDSSQRRDSLTGKMKLTFDTLRIKSRVMEAFEGDTAHFIATDSVKLARSNFAAIGGVLYYSRQDSIMRLYGNKKQNMWYDSTEIDGDSIVMYQKEKKLDHVIAFGHAFATDPYKDTTVSGRINQLSSQKMTLYVSRDTVRSLVAVDNALSIYFVSSDDKPSGFNRSSGDSLRIDFENNAPKRVAVLSGTEGEYWPERFVKDRGAAFRLGNYERHMDLRPRKEDLILAWTPKEFDAKP